jgi:hypothetical protein
VAGPCEHGNEPSGSVKGGEYLDQLNALASQEGHYSMELASVDASFEAFTAMNVKGLALQL